MSPVAPSPSSGESASAARAAPSASSVTCRSRSRSSRSVCSPSGSKPSVASTSAASSRRRASSAAAPRVSSSCRLRAAVSSRHASRASRRRRSCSSPIERVEHVELVGRAAEAALLELAGHRDQALGGRGEILACHGPAPGIGARAAVAEDAACEHQAGLVLRRQLREPAELVVVEEPLRHVELGLDVGLRAGRADDGRVALRPEQEADRLGQDRLARAGLAGDRSQPRPRDELAFADEDEVLDPEATKQRSGCSG